MSQHLSAGNLKVDLLITTLF